MFTWRLISVSRACLVVYNHFENKAESKLTEFQNIEVIEIVTFAAKAQHQNCL